MRTITATEAARGFSHLLDEVAAGERITVTRSGVPVATLGPPRRATLSDLVASLDELGPVPDFARGAEDGTPSVDMTPPDRWSDA
ncbi:type II toxin-antitoxin system Phd/YefM family antitoxin [Isoptericola jiangsuensis]|nr:type II toxin-antitoxin system prevent-host-death family antitoxin [Isoptericola jiangsuensis]